MPYAFCMARMSATAECEEHMHGRHSSSARSMCAQVDSLEHERAQLQGQMTALEAENQRHLEDIEFQDAEMSSLKEAVASQVDELVRCACCRLPCMHPRRLIPRRSIQMTMSGLRSAPSLTARTANTRYKLLSS